VPPSARASPPSAGRDARASGHVDPRAHRSSAASADARLHGAAALQHAACCGCEPCVRACGACGGARACAHAALARRMPRSENAANRRTSALALGGMAADRACGRRTRRARAARALDWTVRYRTAHQAIIIGTRTGPFLLPPGVMAAPAKTVKDVSSHAFVKEYASYLRSTGKARLAAIYGSRARRRYAGVRERSPGLATPALGAGVPRTRQLPRAWRAGGRSTRRGPRVVAAAGGAAPGRPRRCAACAHAGRRTQPSRRRMRVRDAAGPRRRASKRPCKALSPVLAARRWRCRPGWTW
jgi:hypothetical protein